MSIIHEALKKAQQKPQFSAGFESVNKVSVSAEPSPWNHKKNLSKGLIAVGGISFVFWWCFLSNFPVQKETYLNEQVDKEKSRCSLGYGTSFW